MPSNPPAAAPVNAASAPMNRATTMMAAHMISSARTLNACANR